MAILKVKDGDGNDVYMSVTGSGTAGDPYKAAHVLVDEFGVPLNVTHGALTVNTNEPYGNYSVLLASDAGGVLSQTLITPASGKILHVKATLVSTEASTGTISLDMGALIVNYLWPEKGVAHPGVDLHMFGGVDVPLTITGTSIGNAKGVFAMISYIEQDPIS